MRKLMNRKAGMVVLALLITVCSAPAMAGAFRLGGGQSGKGFEGKGYHSSPLGVWRSPQMVGKLALTDGQVDQLRDLEFSHREKQQASRAELDSLRLQMDKAFTEKSVDNAVVRQTAEKLADVKGRMFVEKTEVRLALQEILTAEQLDKLKQYRMNDKRKGMQPNRKQMKGQKRVQRQDCGRYSENGVE
jgi:Spy/CpxP family protein refolding chaperone